ncbi:transposase [Bacteroidota bacterium]
MINFLLRRIHDNFIHSAEVVAFCLMPNHYHLIVKILDEKIIIETILKTFISYSKAINKSYSRTGHLFEGRFRYKLIPDNNYLLHLSRYIHLNPVRAGLVNHPSKWEFSSYLNYIGYREDGFIKHQIITEQVSDYKDFVLSYTVKDYNYIKDLLIA